MLFEAATPGGKQPSALIPKYLQCTEPILAEIKSAMKTSIYAHRKKLYNNDVQMVGNKVNDFKNYENVCISIIKAWNQNSASETN